MSGRERAATEPSHKQAAETSKGLPTGLEAARKEDSEEGMLLVCDGPKKAKQSKQAKGKPAEAANKQKQVQSMSGRESSHRAKPQASSRNK